jgi:hypothetical protein
MAATSPGRSVDTLGALIEESDYGKVLDRASALLHGGAPVRDVIEVAATATARSTDFEGQLPARKHGLLLLSTAAKFNKRLEGEEALLPVLQAVWFCTRERKTFGKKEAVEAPPATDASIEALLAELEKSIREGAVDKAEQVFLSLMQKGVEQQALADLLFQLSLEDMVNGGHNAIFAALDWQLVQYLGWEFATPLLRPLVRYLATNPRDYNALKAIQAMLEKVPVDMATARNNQIVASEEDIQLLRRAIGGKSANRALAAVHVALDKGMSPDSILDAVNLAAVDKMLRAGAREDTRAVHGVTFTNAVRYILKTSKRPEALLGVFQAAAWVNSMTTSKELGNLTPKEPLKPGELTVTVRQIQYQIDKSQEDDALATAARYVSSDVDLAPLVKALMESALQDLGDGGHKIKYAYTCLEEFDFMKTTQKPMLFVALAKYLANKRKDKDSFQRLGSAR